MDFQPFFADDPPDEYGRDEDEEEFGAGSSPLEEDEYDTNNVETFGGDADLSHMDSNEADMEEFAIRAACFPLDDGPTHKLPEPEEIPMPIFHTEGLSKKAAPIFPNLASIWDNDEEKEAPSSNQTNGPATIADVFASMGLPKSGQQQAEYAKASLEDIEQRLGSLGKDAFAGEWASMLSPTILSMQQAQPVPESQPKQQHHSPLPTHAAVSAEELERRMLMEAALEASRQPTTLASSQPPPGGVFRPTPVLPQGTPNIMALSPASPGVMPMHRPPLPASALWSQPPPSLHVGPGSPAFRPPFNAQMNARPPVQFRLPPPPGFLPATMQHYAANRQRYQHYGSGMQGGMPSRPWPGGPPPPRPFGFRASSASMMPPPPPPNYLQNNYNSQFPPLPSQQQQQQPLQRPDGSLGPSPTPQNNNFVSLMPGNGPPMGAQLPPASSSVHGMMRRERLPSHRIRPNLPSMKTISDYAFDPYMGLLSKKEREWLIKIHLIQCAGTGDLLEDDFYYTVWKQRHELKRSDSAKKEKGRYYSFEETWPSDRYVPPSFSGSLGRLTHCSATVPRQVIDVSTQEEEDICQEMGAAGGAKGQGQGAASQKRLKTVLMRIENAALLLTECRNMRRHLTTYLELTSEERAELTEALSRSVALLFGYACDVNLLPAVMMVQKGRTLLLKIIAEGFFDAAQMNAIVTAFYDCLPKYAKRIPDDAISTSAIGLFRMLSTMDKMALIRLSNGVKLEEGLLETAKFAQLALLALLVALSNQQVQLSELSPTSPVVQWLTVETTKQDSFEALLNRTSAVQLPFTSRQLMPLTYWLTIEMESRGRLGDSGCNANALLKLLTAIGEE